ncbi:MAG: hypothetical protein V3T72_21825 [Thermoanaerobaculia bacterium]
MPKKILLTLAVCIATLATPVLAQAADEAGGDMTLDEIIAKNIEARGGMEALKAVESARIQGKMAMGQGMEAPVTITFKRPNKVRMEFVIQGMTGITAYDGETGWGVMPFMGKTEPEPLADDQLKEIVDRSDFDGPLVDWQEKGHTVELVGMTDVEGTPAYELKITKKNGDVVRTFLDTEYFLEFRQKGKRNVQGNDMVIISTLGDYKEVGDLVMAHSFEATPEGTEFKQTVTLENVELNVEVDDAIFDMPEPEKKEETADAKDGR